MLSLFLVVFCCSFLTTTTVAADGLWGYIFSFLQGGRPLVARVVCDEQRDSGEGEDFRAGSKWATAERERAGLREVLSPSEEADVVSLARWKGARAQTSRPIVMSTRLINVGEMVRREPFMLIFEGLREKPRGYALVERRESRCRGSLCAFLSSALPSYFSQKVGVVRRYSDVDIEDGYRRGNLEVIARWKVDKLYSEQAQCRVESDVEVPYGYKEDLDDFSGLGRASYKLWRKGWWTYCNLGLFSGHANSALYPLYILDRFCEIHPMPRDLLFFPASILGAKFDPLYRDAPVR